jgi:hypothetical protein
MLSCFSSSSSHNGRKGLSLGVGLTFLSEKSTANKFHTYLSTPSLAKSYYQLLRSQRHPLLPSRALHIDYARSLAKPALLTYYISLRNRSYPLFFSSTLTAEQADRDSAGSRFCRSFVLLLRFSLPCRTLPERLELLSTLLGLSVLALNL